MGQPDGHCGNHRGGGQPGGWVYVQTKQYIEEIAKQKLGLVNPDEILLKPAPKE